MKIRRQNLERPCAIALLVLAVTCLTGTFLPRTAPAQAPAGVTGPDLIVGDINGTAAWGEVDGTLAYSVGIDSCNIGDQSVQWEASTSQHPVMGRALFRLENGRFEMIGMSWLRHGFCALNAPLCGTCEPTACESLGVGCSSTSSASINGTQSILGPRSEVNPSSVSFPYPPGGAPIGSLLDRRLQVRIDDLDPSMHGAASFFVESLSLAADDKAAGNQNNNASHRQVTFGPSPGYAMTLTGPTMQGQAAIEAWRAADAGVTLTPIEVPGDGTFIVGSRATDNGDGTWHYEYAVYNLDSHRAAGAFIIPIASGVTVTDLDFHDVDYHSGEPYDDSDWQVVQTIDELRWSTATFDENANANALRWSTLYNFRFDSPAPPQQGLATLELFRAGSPAEILAPVDVPSATSAVRVVITPGNTRIVPGTQLEFEVAVENSTANAVTIDSWLDVTKPNGQPYAGNPVVGPKQATLQPGTTVRRTVRLRIPSRIPPSGPYVMAARIGTFPTTVDDSSEFSFDVVDP